MLLSKELKFPAHFDFFLFILNPLSDQGGPCFLSSLENKRMTIINIWVLKFDKIQKFEMGNVFHGFWQKYESIEFCWWWTVADTIQFSPLKKTMELEMLMTLYYLLLYYTYCKSMMPRSVTMTIFLLILSAQPNNLFSIYLLFTYYSTLFCMRHSGLSLPFWFLFCFF